MNLAIIVAMFLAAFQGSGAPDRRQTAEEFLRGVYGCRPEAVRKIGARSVTISYPAFRELFGTPAIRGRDAVSKFSERFCTRWKAAELKIDDSVVEGDEVVLMWSFKAKSAVEAKGMPPKGTVRRWGGISLFRFDKAGKITLEVGEESSPGPAARIETEGPGAVAR